MSSRRETPSAAKKSRRASVAARASTTSADASLPQGRDSVASVSSALEADSASSVRKSVMSDLGGPAADDAGSLGSVVTPALGADISSGAQASVPTTVHQSSDQLDSLQPDPDPLDGPPSSAATGTLGESGDQASGSRPQTSPKSAAALAEEERIATLKELPGGEDKLKHDALYIEKELEYDRALREVMENDDLSTFRIEYEKMHRAVARSKEHVEKLFNQFESSHGEYCIYLVQTQDAKEASIQDQQTIKTLKTQIKKAEDIVTTSNRREEIAKEELRQLRVDISNLNNTLNQGVGLSVTQEKALQELMQTKEQSVKELDEELEKIVHLRNAIAEVSEKIKTADQQKRDLEREIYELRDKGASKKADIDAELRNKERLERDLRELRVVVAVKSQEVRGRQDAVNRATDDISILESQIKSQKHMMDKLQKDQESLTIRTIKSQEDADVQMTTTSRLIEENQILATQLRLREAELAKNLFEAKRVAKIKEALNKKIHGVEEQRVEAELERKDIRGECEDAVAKIEKIHKQTDTHRKAIDDLTRERDILQASFRKAQNELQRHGQALVLCTQARHNIELELFRYDREMSYLTKEVARLEAERDAYSSESLNLQGVCVADIQSIKKKEIELYDFKKRTVQADTKLKHQQNLYEAVQSDRNLHSKHLIEAQNDISEMRRKLKIMNSQINGFKEDINSKNQALAAEAAEHTKLEKDIELITEEINTLQHQNELGQTYLRIQANEMTRLNQFVKDAEMERSRQENALKILITERDNLSNQLISQNEELAKIYNEIKLQQSNLLRNEQNYRHQLAALGQTRREIFRMRQENATLQSENASLQDMKDMVHYLESDLLQEQTKRKALEDQLQHPINVHRWRKLEGRNPKAFDMIQLLHTLQRKLIAKSKEESDKEQLIQNKEALYLHLKSLLAKQVGPEAFEQIEEYQHILKDKSMQFKHMGTELNMYQAQLREYNYSISQLNEGLVDIKRHFMQRARPTTQT